MIIREWRCRARLSVAHAYPKHFETKVLPKLAQVPGCLGATLSRRPLGELVEFLVLTRWTSMDAVRSFAGADAEKSVVEPAALEILSVYDLHVRHYEVLHDMSSE